MVKEAGNIDFLTTGRQPSESEFKKVSKWIADRKNKLQKKSPPIPGKAIMPELY
jgi:hypothetical protein